MGSENGAVASWEEVNWVVVRVWIPPHLGYPGAVWCFWGCSSPWWVDSGEARAGVASAVVARSAALLDGDRDGVLAAGAAFAAAGCRYQWARSLLLAGGPDAARGTEAMLAMGAITH